MPHASRHPAIRPVACGVAIAFALCAGGCEWDQAINEPNDPDEHVTLVDVAEPDQREQGQIGQPVEQIEQPDTTEPADPPAGPERYAVTVTRIVFDRPAPRLALALSALNGAPVDPEVAARWHDNGFGLATIDRSRLPLFLANLPDSHGVNHIRHASPINDTPAVLVGRISGRQRVDYVPPSGEPIQLALTRGKMQLLMRLTADETDEGEATGDVRLVLVPHHYKPAMSLLPRSPLEKVYDGRVFEDLRVNEPAPTDTAWIVWADLEDPPPQPEPDVLARPENLDEALDSVTGDDAGADDPETDGAPDDGDAEPAPPARERDIFAPVEPPTVSLAEAMLTGRRGRHPAQIVLVIHVDRIDR